MVCNQCKNQLREGAKFCGQCGTKTVLGKESATDKAVDAGYLSKILSVNAMGPDSDGDMSVEVRFSISNQSGSNWDQLITRTQLISDSGYIEETTDTHEQLVEDGKTEEFEISFYGVKVRPFIAFPEKGKVIINLIACTATSKNFDEVELPISSFEIVKIEPCQISNAIQLISGGVWRTDPDDDKDVRVETRWLVKNTSGDQIPEIKFIAEVVGNGGTQIGDAGGYEELRPFSTSVVSGSTYAKEKKLKGAKLALSALVMLPTVVGSIEYSGISITDSANDDTQESKNEISDIPDSSSFVDSSGAIEVALRDEEGDEFIYWVKLDSMPIGDDEIDWAINEATNFHIKNHGTNPATSLNDSDLPISAYEPFSRQADEFVWVQSTTGDLELAGLDIETDQNNRVLVEWSIKRAAINVEEIEDEETRSAINSVIQLCKEEKYEEAVGMLPEINFEFDSGSMDSSPDAYLAEGVDSFVVDPSNPRHSLRVGVDGDRLILSIAVIFEMSLVAGVTADELDEWLTDNGGWAAATAAGQWQYSEDDGGSFASFKSNMQAESNIQQVSCRYCVDFGKYIFASEEERDAFIKDPQFIFDFQPGNVDDKKGLIRIFGSTVNIAPIYKDNVPKFIITHLEKNEDNDLGVIVSVEVEMAFEIQVGIEEFRGWIDSSDSTWRYSGRIECVGEDGLEDSDREEYEFDW